MDIVLINLDSEPQRLVDATKELNKYGLKFERIPGVIDAEPERGFSKAMVNALESIPRGGIIFEDDVLLNNFYIPDMPDGWDMLYFGANLKDKTTRISDDIVRVFGAWTTHAIMYSKKAVAKILSTYNYDLHGVYDDWLRTDFNSNNRCYMVTPMQAYQRPGTSAITGEQCDYRECMDENYSTYVN